MALVFVGGAAGSADVNTLTYTFGSTIATARHLFFLVGHYHNTRNLLSVTGDFTGTIDIPSDESVTRDDEKLALASAPCPSGVVSGDDVTFTFDNNVIDRTVLVCYTTDTISGFQSAATGTDASTDDYDTGSLTNSASPAVYVAGTKIVFRNTTAVVDSPFTAAGNYHGGGGGVNHTLSASYLDAATAASRTSSGTWADPGQAWQTIMGAYTIDSEDPPVEGDDGFVWVGSLRVPADRVANVSGDWV
jgi:hypothetical protein